MRTAPRIGFQKHIIRSRREEQSHGGEDRRACGPKAGVIVAGVELDAGPGPLPEAGGEGESVDLGLAQSDVGAEDAFFDLRADAQGDKHGAFHDSTALAERFIAGQPLKICRFGSVVFHQPEVPLPLGHAGVVRGLESVPVGLPDGFPPGVDDPTPRCRFRARAAR